MSLFTNEDLISDCVRHQKPIMAPMFRSPRPSLTSNFGTADMYNENETTSYETIIDRKEIGCFSVLTIGVPYFLDLHRVKQANLNRDWSSVISDKSLDLFVCNREINGFTLRYSEIYQSNVQLMCDGFNHLLTEYQLTGTNKSYVPLPGQIPELSVLKSGKSVPINVDKTYVINLERRPDRLERTKAALEVLQLQAEISKAVDGLKLTHKHLESQGVKIVDSFLDPYNKRKVNMGEVACFLSHYRIWEDAFNKKFETVMVLEDDVRFEFLFAHKLNYTLTALKEQKIDWDLIYLGRKIMGSGEDFVAGIPTIVRPLYSHWTVGYLLSANGVKKLMDSKPLEKLIPVDEYLPLMFDKHPDAKLKEYYTARDLITFAFQPAIIQPTHYYGESNYVSDTENTTIV